MPRLPADAFVGQLKEVCVAIGNRLDREWPANRPSPEGEQVVLRSLVLASGNTFSAVLYSCAELPPDPLRKIEYSLAFPPLARVILEAVFTVNFLFEDLPVRAKWFMLAGWRAMAEEHALSVSTFGADANWREWLDSHERAVSAMADGLGIAFVDRATPEVVAKYWPTPGKMMNDPSLGADRLARMRYLDQWFYGQFSSAAHLKWSGLARSTAPLLRHHLGENLKAGLVKSRSDVIVSAAVMLLALLSEIEIEMRFGHSAQLKYVWVTLGEVVDYVKFLYESHYQPRL